jgi:hypothetical protein
MKEAKCDRLMRIVLTVAIQFRVSARCWHGAFALSQDHNYAIEDRMIVADGYRFRKPDK